MKTKLIGYWIITTTLALALLSGGLAGLIQRPENVEFLTHIGYPVYFGIDHRILERYLVAWRYCHQAFHALKNGLTRGSF